MKRFFQIAAALAAVVAPVAPSYAGSLDGAGIDEVQSAFDNMLGTSQRAPRTYSSGLEQQLASLAEASRGRIGVAALDLTSGRTVDVLGDQRFPMASTSKIAIAATFLEGVDQGRFSLSSEFPMMMPVPSRPFSTAVAPVRPGTYMSARSLIEAMITRSNNYATDALLKVVGGPRAVNDWVRRAGVNDWHIDRDIATLVRDDGAVNPATTIDTRDSATPLAMVRLLSQIYSGQMLSPASRDVLLGAMGRCLTGKRRIPALLPSGTTVLHKTGSLNNTSSDVGIIQTPDGRAYAIAIYVTGQGTRLARETRIASIASALYHGYAAQPSIYGRTAAR
ncbi:serine hydrolase [Novosphingobium fluoreni]|uniref:serine hydrolase n=1 Tax=Novosphingobium fluoreni TaxID=1391222 RepID=UPI003DA033AA